MVYVEIGPVQRFSAIGLALLVTVPLFASSAHARPKSAKHAPAPTGAAADKTPATATPIPDPEPATTEQVTQPPAASHEDKPDKPKLQVTPVAKATDNASESSGATAAAAASNEKLAALRADVTALTDDLVEARSRAAMLGKTLFKTQVRVRLQNLAAPDPVLVKIALKLDGAPIYRGDGSALSGDDARQVFQGFIAPGAHVLSAEIEQRSRQDAAYGYVLHETYRFVALREKRSELTLILDDDSDLASEFPDDSEGEYDVRVKLRVKTKNLSEP
jgi:hypothetical protein